MVKSARVAVYMGLSLLLVNGWLVELLLWRPLGVFLCEKVTRKKVPGHSTSL